MTSTSWSELSALQRDVLCEIRRQQQRAGTVPHGASIRRALSIHREDAVQAPSIYRVIDELVDRGLVSRERVDGRRKQLQVTEPAVLLLEEQARILAAACALSRVDEDQDVLVIGGQQ